MSVLIFYRYHMWGFVRLPDWKVIDVTTSDPDDLEFAKDYMRVAASMVRKHFGDDYGHGSKNIEEHLSRDPHEDHSVCLQDHHRIFKGNDGLRYVFVHSIDSYEGYYITAMARPDQFDHSIVELAKMLELES